MLAIAIIFAATVADACCRAIVLGALLGSQRGFFGGLTRGFFKSVPSLNDVAVGTATPGPMTLGFVRKRNAMGR